ASMFAYRVSAGEQPSVGRTKPAHAEAAPREGELLRWKFEDGKPFYEEPSSEIKVKGSAEVAGTFRVTFYFCWTPQQREDKNWGLIQRVPDPRPLLAVGPQGELLLVQQSSARPMSAGQSALPQRRRQLPDRLVRPLQARHRIGGRAIAPQFLQSGRD